MLILINEGTTTQHTLEFLNAAGDQVVPEALRYRVEGDLDVEIVAWTSLPAETTEIVVPGAVNLIGENGGRKRHLTVEATHNGGKIITEELEYYLRDLRGYPTSA